MAAHYQHDNNKHLQNITGDMANLTDPYSVIKAEIERELQQIGPLQAELFAHYSLEKASSFRQQLEDVQQQLAALEKAVQAMVAAPAQYRLDLRTAYTRQVEVETLRFQLSDLQATSSHIPADAPDAGAAGAGSRGSSSGRPHQSIELHAMAGSSHPSSNGHLSSSSSSRSHAALLKHSKLVQHHGGGVGSKAGSQQQPSTDSRPQPDAGLTSFNTIDDDGLASYESVMQQQVQQQEQDLDHISLHVDRIKQTGQLMHEELEEQSLLLGGLQSDTDTTQLRLRGVRRKVGDVLKQARNDRQLCLILVLSLVLVVLVMLALA